MADKWGISPSHLTADKDKATGVYNFIQFFMYGFKHYRAITHRFEATVHASRRKINISAAVEHEGYNAIGVSLTLEEAKLFHQAFTEMVEQLERGIEKDQKSK